MSFIFTPQRVVQLGQRHRSGQVSATLLLSSVPVRAASTRHYYKQFAVHDPDGVFTGIKRVRIEDLNNAGERRPARLTVILIEPIDISAISIKDAVDGFLALDNKMAQACGFKSVQDLRADWRNAHPQSLFGKCVWFALGDVRDNDRFLQRWVHRGGDYTGAKSEAIDHLPALTVEQLEELSAHNHQRNIKRQADTEQAMAQETLAQRVARLENASAMILIELENELSIINERAHRGIRRLARSDLR